MVVQETGQGQARAEVSEVLSQDLVKLADFERTKSEESPQQLQGPEVETAVHAPRKRAHIGRRLGDLAEGDAVGPRGPGPGAEDRPKGVGRTVGVIQPEAIHPPLQPAHGVIDQVVTHARVVRIELGQVRQIVVAFVLIGPIGEAKPLVARTAAISLGGEEGRMLPGYVVGHVIQDDAYPPAVGLI